MSLERLREEYEAEGIGSVIYAEVVAIVRSAVGRYDPVVYGRAASWDRSAIDDLVQEVVVGRLLEEGQLDYVFLHAHDLDHLRALLALQVRRTLARTRTRTVVDNLLDRAKLLAQDSPFEFRSDSRNRWAFRLAGIPDQDANGRSFVGEAARAVQPFPRVPNVRGERAPMVYTSETLTLVMRTVALVAIGWVSVKNLDEVLRNVLTPWIPSVLEQAEGDHEGDPDPSPADELLACHAAERIVDALDADRRKILRMKLTDASDAEVAVALGISRPTVANRKHEVFDRIKQELEDVPVELHDFALDWLFVRLAEAAP